MHESRRFPGGGLPGRGLPGRLIPAGVFPAVTYPSRGYPGGDYSRQSVCRQPDLKAGTFLTLCGILDMEGANVEIVKSIKGKSEL